MTERSYLFGYGTGPWGSSSRKTKAEILATRGFAAVNPEIMRRLFALADAVIDAGSDFGFGGGTRFFAEQDAEFRRRHFIAPTGIWFYDGHWWQRWSWAAPYAPPGHSWHEQTSSNGGAVAVDCLGDHVKAGPIAGAYGLVNGISGEAWHYQAREIPHARALNQVWPGFAAWPIPAPIPPTPIPPTPGGPIVAQSLVSADYRFYDSREKDGPLRNADAPRQLRITDSNAKGAVGVIANLTIADTVGAGNLTAWKSGPNPGTSKLNWTGPGQIDANEITIWLDGFGGFLVDVDGTTDAETDLVIDIAGYWMP